MNATKIAITRPIFVLMLMLAVILAGTVSYFAMRKEQNPEVQFGVVTISTIYPGAGPDEVSTLVSRKIEESVSGVNGLLEVTSSSQEGVSVVVANFEVGTNMDSALSDVRAKVDTVVSQLPREAEKPVVGKVDSGSDPVIYYSISSKSRNAQELRDLVDDVLKDRFARIKGVGQVNVTGGDERELRVHLKKDKLLSYGLGIVDVQRAIKAATMNVPAGRIIGDNQETAVRVLGEFKTVEDLKNTVIRVSDPMNPSNAATFKLSDVADVVDTAAEKREYSRVNGAESVVMTIQKAKEGNAVEISDAAKSVQAAVEKEYGLTMVKTQDSAKFVSESLFDLTFALIFGIILVCAIVYMFLHNFRGMLIVAVAIPICLLATLWVLRMLGFTINNMSMLALSLAIGVLVDDAIVVLENIYRHLAMGEEPRTAALNGRMEIGSAALAITLADIVVFLPMGFMGGIVGQFFKPLGIGFAVAVFMSLIVSFTVTPMLAARWYREGEDVEHVQGRFATWFEKRFDRLREAYRRSLEWALAHRWFVFISGFTVLLGVFMAIAGSNQPDVTSAIKSTMMMVVIYPVFGLLALIVTWAFTKETRPRILWGAMLFGLTMPLFAVMGLGYRTWKGDALFKGQFFPASDQGRIEVRIETLPGTTLDRTLDVTKRVEQIVLKHPDVAYAFSRVGTWSGAFAGSGSSRSTNLAAIVVTLHDKVAILDRLQPWVKHEEKLRYRTDVSVAGDFIEQIGRVPGARITVSAASSMGFGKPIQMSFASDDRALLQRTIQRIKDGLESGKIAGIINVDTSSKPGKPELRVIPDRARAADANVSTEEMAGTLRTLYEGNDDTKYRVLGKEYPIRVMMDPADRNDPDLLSSVPVKFWMGDPIFLPQVATIDRGVTVDKVDRRNRQEEIQINADLLPGKAAGNVQQEIDEWIKQENVLPAGVVKKSLGQADVQAREGIYMMTTLIMGLVLVYMVLAALYENLLYPFIIQLAQPQAFVGALLALILTDKSLNIVGFIGLIALVGLVGKNAILLVDYTNTLRARGHDRHSAIVEAGPTRLRPISMTTLAIILGTLPTALAIGRGSEFRETLGIIIIGGIALSTLLTLLVIPCSYTIFDDLSRLISKMRGKEDLAPASQGEAELAVRQ